MKLKVLCIALVLVLCAAAKAQDAHIRINQAGYQPADAKKAVVFSKKPLNGFFGAEDMISGKPTLLRMPLQPINPSPWGGNFEHYYELDFSSVRAPGRYRLRLAASGLASREFTIGQYPGYHEDLLF